MLSFVAVYNRAMINNACIASEQSVKQASVTVSNYLDTKKEQMKEICEELNKYDALEDSDEMVTLAARLQKDIEAVNIYDENGNLLSCGSSGGTLKTNLKNNLSYNKDLFSKANGYAISLPHVQNMFEDSYPWVITIVHKEYIELFKEDVYIAIDFSFADIARYINNIGIGQHGYCYIIANGGNVVYHPQQQMIFSGIKSENFAEAEQLPDGANKINNEIITLNSVIGTGWRTVGISYIDDLSVPKNKMIIYILFLTLLGCAIVTLILNSMYYLIVTKPVHSIVNSMKKFEKDTVNFRYAPKSEIVTELQTISDSFGHMAENTIHLMDRIKKEEITLRKTELKALQAQINPHFLYNTLDSIQWMCEKERSKDAIKMVSALAKLFRISISHGNELITVKDELKHVQSYLVIQSYRYKNQFEYKFITDEEVLGYLVNKITLQPLVENAIYHGIDRMVDEGKITITAKSDGDDLVFIVEDNGVGMTSEQCMEILSKEHSDSRGIGIKNVNDRIKIYFGDSYGIKIESELDVGTKIIVRLPKCEKEPKDEV